MGTESLSGGWKSPSGVQRQTVQASRSQIYVCNMQLTNAFYKQYRTLPHQKTAPRIIKMCIPKHAFVRAGLRYCGALST